jgi:hypothetical protein
MPSKSFLPAKWSENEEWTKVHTTKSKKSSVGSLNSSGFSNKTKALLKIAQIDKHIDSNRFYHLNNDNEDEEESGDVQIISRIDTQSAKVQVTIQHKKKKAKSENKNEKQIKTSENLNITKKFVQDNTTAVTKTNKNKKDKLSLGKYLNQSDTAQIPVNKKGVVPTKTIVTKTKQTVNNIERTNHES